jgi:hypothetical protein
MGRKYEINENYFQNIDSEAKAYILGYLFADGCIRKCVGNRQDSLYIGVQEKDRLICDLISKEISPENPVRIVHAPSMIKAGHQPQARWRCSSNKISDDLKNLGMNYRKSQTGMTFPSLDSSLIHHFIRGFFDGDGCISVNEVKNRYKRKTNFKIKKPFKRKLRKRAYFCSTDEQFLIDLFSHLPKFEGKIYKVARKRVSVCHIYNIEHQKDVLRLRDYLYSNATFFLERKKNKFDMTISSQAEDTSSEGSETSGEVESS